MNVEYLEIQPLMATEALRRQKQAALSWEQKVAVIERMRQLLLAGASRERTVTTPDPCVSIISETLPTPKLL